MVAEKHTGRATETRKQLLAAAVGVIGEKGYSGATVDEIVEAAGVSKGTAFYHFKNKADIAASILEEGIDGLIDDFELIVEGAADAPEALLGMIERFAERIFDNRAFGQFLVSELWREGRVWSGEMRENEHRLLHILEGQIKRGQKEGWFRPEIDAAFESVAVVGMVLTTSLYYIADDSSVFHAGTDDCSIDEAFTQGPTSDMRAEKDAFIGRISDFVRHATVKMERLS